MVEAEILYQFPTNDDAPVQGVELVAVPPVNWDEDEDHGSDNHLPAIVATLQAELARMADGHVGRVQLLHERLEARLLEVERVRAQAIKATVLAEKATSHARRFEEDRARLRDERDALAKRLESERTVTATERQRRIGAERYASMISVLPWYSWRRRRHLRERLEDIVAD